MLDPSFESSRNTKGVESLISLIKWTQSLSNLLGALGSRVR